jgi:hypothetical protein
MRRKPSFVPPNPTTLTELVAKSVLMLKTVLGVRLIQRKAKP